MKESTMIFQAAAALTNLHIKSHPLGSQDGDKYVQLQNHLSHIVNETIEKRRRVLSRYRDHQRRRLNQQFGLRQFESHSSQ